MGVQTAAVLYPVNTTTVDSGTGIDIRLLDSVEAGATDTSQACTAGHTEDNVHRTFDPATGGVTANNDPLTLQKKGWALELAADMTPTDDTNCNCVLEAQTATVSVRVSVGQSGGTYVTGNYAPQWEVSLWRYDPVANTGTLIATGVDSGTSWDYTPATGDLGTMKKIDVSVTIGSLIEFAQGEILLLQVGVDTLTIPNPTLGSSTWTYRLAVDHSGCNITWESGKELSVVCMTEGSATGTGTPTGAAAIVLPTEGAASGSGTVTGTLEADAEMTGSASGLASASGTLEADAEMAGSAAGSASVSGSFGGVIPTVGDVDIGGGGGATNIYPIFPVFD